MRKLMFFIVLTVFIGLSEPVFAQHNTIHGHPESEYYYFNFPLEKIYSHNLGYVVVYRRIGNQFAHTFLPREWFAAMGDYRGDMVFLSTGREWPSMTVYYRNGEFSHVRLRVRHNKAHTTWGVIPLGTSINEYFSGIEEVDLLF